MVSKVKDHREDSPQSISDDTRPFAQIDQVMTVSVRRQARHYYRWGHYVLEGMSYNSPVALFFTVVRPIISVEGRPIVNFHRVRATTRHDYRVYRRSTSFYGRYPGQCLRQN